MEDNRHTHDRRYSQRNHVHDHRYYTEDETDGLVAERMRWAGPWAGGSYEANDVVRDGEWLMIANKPTTDKPAPEPSGDPWWVYTGTSPTTSQTVKSVTYGQRYLWHETGFLLSWRAWFVLGNHYTVWLVKDPDGDAILTQVLDMDAVTGGWQEFGIGMQSINVGTVFELLVVAREPDPTPTVWTGVWNYQTPNNAAVPLPGQATHATRQRDSLRIHKTDNGGGDRSTELEALTIGDIIEAQGVRWSIQIVADNGTWMDFTVAPQQQGTPAGITTFTFETVTPTPITYVEDTGHWSGSPNVQGYLNGTLNQNAYGIDLQVQYGTASPDWDLVMKGVL